MTSEVQTDVHIEHQQSSLVASHNVTKCTSAMCNTGMPPRATPTQPVSWGSAHQSGFQLDILSCKRTSRAEAKDLAAVAGTAAGAATGAGAGAAATAGAGALAKALAAPVDGVENEPNPPNSSSSSSAGAGFADDADAPCRRLQEQIA